MLLLLRSFVLFMAGCGVYLWLDLFDVPGVRIEDFEPQSLVHVYWEAGGPKVARLAVSALWGMLATTIYWGVLAFLKGRRILEREDKRD